MLKTLYESFRWNAKLGKKLISNLPFYTSAIILLTLIAQVATLLSFLLPIKIIMIAGLDGTPSFLPKVFGDVEKSTVVLILSAFTIILFLIQTLARKFSAHASAKGVAKLLTRSEKLVIFENQDEIASNSYKQFCESVAGLTFTAIAITGIGFLYPDAALSLLFFTLVSSLFFEISWRKRKSYRLSLRTNTPKHFNSFATLAFISTFSFITIDFLYFSHPAFIAGILSLIIIRQLNARMGLTVGNLHSLQRKSAKLDALFFRENVFSPNNGPTGENIWTLLASHTFTKDLSDKILKVCAITIDDTSLQWLQTGINNTVFLTAKTSSDCYPEILIKLFNKRQSSSALHEATLLLEPSLEIPAPPLLSATTLKGHHLHVMDISRTEPCTPKSYHDLELKIRYSVTTTPLPIEIQDKYMRSKHLLFDRLTEEMFNRLNLVSQKNQKEVIRQCKEQLPQIQAYLKELPLTLSVDTSWQNIRVTSDGEPLVLHWGAWKIDVAGSDWDACDTSIDEFSNFVKKNNYTMFREVPSLEKKMRLAALARTAEKEHLRQLYRSCLETWIEILKLSSQLSK